MHISPNGFFTRILDAVVPSTFYVYCVRVCMYVCKATYQVQTFERFLLKIPLFFQSQTTTFGVSIEMNDTADRSCIWNLHVRRYLLDY